jgi:secreted PhoX family phosphatase
VAGGGWRYVSNSELSGNQGGVGVLQFDATGRIVDAYRILAGTHYNCAGGATPWGTWLSCEEFRQGRVWECDPTRPGQGVVRRALGTFSHEAAVVDPATGDVYLTEDADERSRFYRFVARRYGDLERGRLQAARWEPDGTVTWVDVPDNRPYRGADTTAFARGEGAWYSDGRVYFTTTQDNRVWMLDVTRQRQTLEVIYDAAALGPDAPLREPDNVTVHPRSGDLYVAEDADDLQLVLLARDPATGDFTVSPFLQLVGHDSSEVAGPAFTPDGTRLYVSSQRGTDGRLGMTFEIQGPFRS